MIAYRLLLSLSFLVVSTRAFTVAPISSTARSSTSVVPSSKTVLYLELPDVDPLVLAAAGLALVGGIGASVLSNKLQGMDQDEKGGGDSAAPAASTADAVDAIDISIPYDAAARLAYEAGGSKGDYEAFKTKYEADAVAEVKAKKGS